MNKRSHGSWGGRPRPAEVRSQRRGSREEGLGQGGAGQTPGAPRPLRPCWCPVPAGCPSEPLLPPPAPGHLRRASLGAGERARHGAEGRVSAPSTSAAQEGPGQTQAGSEAKIHPSCRLCNRCARPLAGTSPSGCEAVWPLPISLVPSPPDTTPCPQCLAPRMPHQRLGNLKQDDLRRGRTQP